MTTRRAFFRLAAQSATAALLAGNHIAAEEQNEVHRVTPRRGRPLLDLQQRFVDLRFGMFVHFNMATFQDREWGDPTSPPDLFHPTALETDQWAAAAQSAIRSYRFQHWNGSSWITLTGGETPAPTTIHRIPRITSQRVRLLLESSKNMPHIAEIGVYNEPA